MRGRRPGSKGNEWLMIKKHDDHVVEGYDIEAIDESVLSGRNLEEIAGDAGRGSGEQPSCRTRKIESCVAGGCGGEARSEKTAESGKKKQAENRRGRRGTQRKHRRDAKKLDRSTHRRNVHNSRYICAPQSVTASKSSASSAAQSFSGTGEAAHADDDSSHAGGVDREAV